MNTELIDLYWHIGKVLHHKIEADGWAKGTVVQLAAYITQREPGLRGFSPQNLWRMRQFFVAYRDFPKLSPLLRELPWSSHLHILSRAKRAEEREFYLRLATQKGAMESGLHKCMTYANLEAGPWSRPPEPQRHLASGGALARLGTEARR